METRQPSWAEEPSPGAQPQLPAPGLKATQRALGSSCCCNIPQGRPGRQGSSSLPSHVRSLSSKAGGACLRASVGLLLGCSMRQCSEARAGGSTLRGQGLCRSQQAVLLGLWHHTNHSPQLVSQAPSFSPSTRTWSLQARMQQHKRRQMYSVLILTSNFTSTSHFGYCCLSRCRYCSGGCVLPCS